MIIGVPKEIKNNENRVGMTPAGVKELVGQGHKVYVQHTAGEGSGFSDQDYINAGASILPTIEETYAIAEMIVKVKEPIEPEYALVKKGQLLFTYFHFASDRALTEAMLASGATCIAYETVRDTRGTLPLLIPMSEVAGRMSVQEGARFLEKPQGGKGILREKELSQKTVIRFHLLYLALVGKGVPQERAGDDEGQDAQGL